MIIDLTGLVVGRTYHIAVIYRGTGRVTTYVDGRRVA